MRRRNILFGISASLCYSCREMTGRAKGESDRGSRNVVNYDYASSPFSDR